MYTQRWSTTTPTLRDILTKADHNVVDPGCPLSLRNQLRIILMDITLYGL